MTEVLILGMLEALVKLDDLPQRRTTGESERVCGPLELPALQFIGSPAQARQFRSHVGFPDLGDRSLYSGQRVTGHEHELSVRL